MNFLNKDRLDKIKSSTDNKKKTEKIKIFKRNKKKTNTNNKLQTDVKEDGKCLTGSSIIKIILGILFEGFLNSILSVSGLKSGRRCPFFNNEVSVILDKFSSYLCVLFLFTTYTGNI